LSKQGAEEDLGGELNVVEVIKHVVLGLDEVLVGDGRRDLVSVPRLRHKLVIPA
jgi:hypothetical protein